MIDGQALQPIQADASKACLHPTAISPLRQTRCSLHAEYPWQYQLASWCLVVVPRWPLPVRRVAALHSAWRL
jgi:hypothetical protein